MTDASTPTASGRIFVSYRREETAYPAGWLYDRLTDRFGAGQVFKDVDSIQLGDDFVEAITGAVGSCDVLLALIGVDWLTITDGKGARRLDDPEDFVRLEIEAALSRKVRVIPILVDGASIPRVDELPASLAGLGRRQALELDPSRFEFDTNRLLRVLDWTLAEVRTGADTQVAASSSAVPPQPPQDAAVAIPSDVPAPRSASSLPARVGSFGMLAVAVGVLVIVLAGVLLLRPGGGSPSLTVDDAPATADNGLRLSDLEAVSGHRPPEVGDFVDVSFTLTNTTSAPISLEEVYVAVRDPSNRNVDREATRAAAVLGAGESLDVTARVPINRSGVWNLWPCFETPTDSCPDVWRRFSFQTG